MTWTRVTQTYAPVTYTGTKTVKCAGGCGRKLRRQRQFRQTRRELRERFTAWETQPETCRECAP